MTSRRGFMKLNQKLGKILHLSSSSGNLILKSDNEVKIGEIVLDSAGNKVGTVFDIIGSISNPFASVKIKAGDPKKYLGKPLFVKRNKR
jgi:rRNA processing protein Gar1